MGRPSAQPVSRSASPIEVEYLSPIASSEVHREPLEIGERAVVEGAFARSPQQYPGRLARLERFLPARRTQAPAVAGPQAGKAEFWHRRRKIIAPGFGKLEELSSHDGADGMTTDVFSTRMAASVSEEPRQRLHRAVFELVAKNISGRFWPAPSVPAIILQHRQPLTSATFPIPATAGRRQWPALILRKPRATWGCASPLGARSAAAVPLGNRCAPARSLNNFAHHDKRDGRGHKYPNPDSGFHRLSSPTLRTDARHALTFMGDKMFLLGATPRATCALRTTRMQPNRLRQPSKPRLSAASQVSYGRFMTTRCSTIRSAPSPGPASSRRACGSVVVSKYIPTVAAGPRS